MNYKDIFSSNLLRLRKEHKLSLQALGDILGISNQAVSLLEKGKNVPSFNVLIAIADFFDVSLDYLVGRTENPNSHKT
jgi:transcriptional regulator with XRE-family HTH domain